MKELLFLVSILNSIYPKISVKPKTLKDINMSRLLKIAEKNNLLYYVCHILKNEYSATLSENDLIKIEKILENGEEEIKKINKSIKYLNAKLSEYVLIKTYRGYPRIANDLDVFVKDFDKAIKILSNNFSSKDYDKKTKEVLFLKEDFAKIHLHGKINWLNRSYFDFKFIREDSRDVFFGEERVAIPNFSADAIIHLAHMNFEPMHFTLSELLYIFSIVDKIDFEKLFKQSKKYNWHGALMKTLQILEDFHFYFYKKPLLSAKVPSLKERHFSDDYYCLPKSFPRTHIIKAFLGKGVLVEPILKIRKVFNVLVSGDSYDNFYEAPERNIKK